MDFNIFKQKEIQILLKNYKSIENDYHALIGNYNEYQNENEKLKL